MDFEKEMLYKVGGNHCKVIEDMIIETARKAAWQSTVKTVYRTLEMGFPLEQIAQLLGLSTEKVKEIAEQKNASQPLNANN